MTKVFTGASMSLDGYIAGPEESGFEHLFKWYGNGDVAVATADPNMTLQMTEVSAKHFRGVVDATGALVVGRRLFDLTSGWGAGCLHLSVETSSRHSLLHIPLGGTYLATDIDRRYPRSTLRRPGRSKPGRRPATAS
jgi:hypothetical protein